MLPARRGLRSDEIKRFMEIIAASPKLNFPPTKNKGGQWNLIKRKWSLGIITILLLIELLFLMGPIFSSSSNSYEMSCANLLRLGGVLISKVVANGLVDRWNKEELRKGSSSRMAVGDRIIALNGEELKGDELLERLKTLSSVFGGFRFLGSIWKAGGLGRIDWTTCDLGESGCNMGKTRCQAKPERGTCGRQFVTTWIYNCSNAGNKKSKKNNMYWNDSTNKHINIINKQGFYISLHTRKFVNIEVIQPAHHCSLMDPS